MHRSPVLDTISSQNWIFEFKFWIHYPNLYIQISGLFQKTWKILIPCGGCFKNSEASGISIKTSFFVVVDSIKFGWSVWAYNKCQVQFGSRNSCLEFISWIYLFFSFSILTIGSVVTNLNVNVKKRCRNINQLQSSYLQCSYCNVVCYYMPVHVKKAF